MVNKKTVFDPELNVDFPAYRLKIAAMKLRIQFPPLFLKNKDPSLLYEIVFLLQECFAK